jgi:hypothetical protein
MSSSLPEDVRQMVAERAGYRCEYCLIPDSDSFLAFHIDHIIALKHRGRSVLTNLAYSCALCNMRKGSDVASFDEVTGRVVPLFHPRHDDWAEHFSLEHGVIAPRTDVGRVTVALLDLNHPHHVQERELLSSTSD